MPAWYEYPLAIQERNLDVLRFFRNSPPTPKLLKTMVCYAVVSSMGDERQVNYVAELHALNESTAGLWHIDVTDESAHLSSYDDSPGVRTTKSPGEFHPGDGFEGFLDVITAGTTPLDVVVGRNTRWLGDVVLVTVGDILRSS